MKNGLSRLAVVALALNLALSGVLRADDSPKTNSTDMVPLQLKLPAPVFAGTPKAAPADIVVEDKPDPTIMVPKDVKNLAPSAKITSSDKTVTRAELAKITDGIKDADGEDIVQMRKGLQWIQFDLGAPKEIYGIAFWHAHDIAKICRAVIVQVADDEDFTENVRTLYNNDRENSAGMGAGKDRQYFESFRGKSVDAKGTRARYVRLYSNGSTDNKMNEYTEVEIWGRAAK